MEGVVGKTTLLGSLAYCAATILSRLTLLWDINAQGAASSLCAQVRPDAKAKRVFSREVEPLALVEQTQWLMLDLLLSAFSIVDRRKKLHREFLAEHPDWPVVPHASVVERMAVVRSPVTAYAGNSPAAGSISKLWSRLSRFLKACGYPLGGALQEKFPEFVRPAAEGSTP